MQQVVTAYDSFPVLTFLCSACSSNNLKAAAYETKKNEAISRS